MSKSMCPIKGSWRPLLDAVSRSGVARHAFYISDGVQAQQKKKVKQHWITGL